jgi:hypothetical protein
VASTVDVVLVVAGCVTVAVLVVVTVFVGCVTVFVSWVSGCVRSTVVVTVGTVAVETAACACSATVPASPEPHEATTRPATSARRTEHARDTARRYGLRPCAPSPEPDDHPFGMMRGPTRTRNDRHMHDSTAREIALKLHADQRDRFGEPILEHLERVAAAVPADARRTAWLHDSIERTRVSVDELRMLGLTGTELDAIALLSRSPSESYELYALRIAFAAGEAGRLARTVKVADLDDHIAHGSPPVDAPPYRWARRHIAARLV